MSEITIEQLYELQEISTRAYNICVNGGFISTKDLRAFYAEYKTFSVLRNCGRRSDEELIEVCQTYTPHYIENLNEKFENKNYLNTLISNLTQIQKDVINGFIESETNSLSVRNCNIMLHYLENDFSIENFAKKTFLHNKFRVNMLRGVGLESASDLQVYISNIKDITLEICKTTCQEYLTIVKNKFFIQHTFSISLPDEIVESQSIFSLINFLLNQHALFDKKQTFVVKNAFRLYQNQKELMLKDIAKLIDLTTQRVTQIRNRCYEHLFDKIAFIENLKQDLYKNYNIDVNSHYIHITDATVETINRKNSTSFSKQFITYLLGIHLYNKFGFIGNLEEALLINYTKYKGKHEWKNIYLIKKETVGEFN